jgi:hypothetical protein
MQLAYAAAAKEAPKAQEPEPDDLEPVDDEELGGEG